VALMLQVAPGAKLGPQLIALVKLSCVLPGHEDSADTESCIHLWRRRSTGGRLPKATKAVEK
jgi:hypothetical protein